MLFQCSEVQSVVSCDCDVIVMQNCKIYPVPSLLSRLSSHVLSPNKVVERRLLMFLLSLSLTRRYGEVRGLPSLGQTARASLGAGETFISKVISLFLVNISYIQTIYVKLTESRQEQHRPCLLDTPGWSSLNSLLLSEEIKKTKTWFAPV